MTSRFRVGPSTVIATAALLVALGGTSYAATSAINGSELQNRSVGGDKLKEHTVTGTDVKVSSFGKVPSAQTADDAKNLDGYVFVQIDASASGSAPASLLNGFGGLTLECVGPVAGGDAGTVNLVIVTDSPETATFGASAVESAGAHYDEGAVAPGTPSVPEDTSFTFPISDGAQLSFSYKRKVGSTTAVVSGTFTMVLNDGCSAFGNAEVSSVAR
ncbi:MAG: hypothetical protein ACLPQS_16465 [Acidimicrobiales bacterium]